MTGSLVAPGRLWPRSWRGAGFEGAGRDTVVQGWTYGENADCGQVEYDCPDTTKPIYKRPPWTQAG